MADEVAERLKGDALGDELKISTGRDAEVALVLDEEGIAADVA